MTHQVAEGTGYMDKVVSYRNKLVSPGGPANWKLTVTRGQHLEQTRHRKNTGSGPEGTFALIAICAHGAHSTGGPVLQCGSGGGNCLAPLPCQTSSGSADFYCTCHTRRGQMSSQTHPCLNQAGAGWCLTFKSGRRRARGGDRTRYMCVRVPLCCSSPAAYESLCYSLKPF